MGRMTTTERETWRDGDAAIAHSAARGGFQCDLCPNPSAAVSHQGEATPVVVQCAACFIAGRDQAKREARAAAGRFMAAMAR